MPRVSKTSGQGVSRKAYQSAYALGQHGRGSGGASHSALKSEDGDTRQYSKKDVSEPKTNLKFNVSYGDTYEPTDLKDLKAMFAEKPNKASKMLDLSGPRKMKGFKL
jgi:hypothetical protein